MLTTETKNPFSLFPLAPLAAGIRLYGADAIDGCLAWAVYDRTAFGQALRAHRADNPGEPYENLHELAAEAMKAEPWPCSGPGRYFRSTVTVFVHSRRVMVWQSEGYDV